MSRCVTDVLAERGNAEVQVKPAIYFNADKTGARPLFGSLRPQDALETSLPAAIPIGQLCDPSKAGPRAGRAFNFRTLFEAQRDLYRLGSSSA